MRLSEASRVCPASVQPHSESYTTHADSISLIRALCVSAGGEERGEEIALLCDCHRGPPPEREHALIAQAQQLPPGVPEAPRLKNRGFYQLQNLIGTHE